MYRIPRLGLKFRRSLIEAVINGKENRVVELSENGYVNGVVKKRYVNGSVGDVNGSLVKYENGNGAVGTAVREAVIDGKKKKSIEEIGQEEAWFKQDKKYKPEVR